MYNPVIGPESRDLFSGMYRAVVVDNVDPDEAGRVRARVWPMMEGVEDDTLPWAIPTDPFMGGLANIGGFIVPEVNAHIWVFFEAGDIRSPVYFAGAPAMVEEVPDAPSESRDNGQYPKNKVFKTRAGILVELDDSDGAVRIKLSHPSGTSTETENDGNRTTIVVGDDSLTIEKDHNVIILGSETYDITENRHLTVEGNNEVSVTGTETIDIDESQTATITGFRNTTVGAGDTLHVIGNLNISVISGVCNITAPVINLN